MKTLKLLFLFTSLVFLFSCNKDEETALFAVPQIKKLSDIRASVGVRSSRTTNSDGKIYVTENMLFYIAQESGVHIFSNTNPSNPTNLSFLEIAGVHDIAVKGNYLFADNYVDLLVFDISNINNITLVKTVENTFNFYPEYPEDAEYFAWDEWAGEGEICVGYQMERRPLPDEQYVYAMEDAIGGDLATAMDGNANSVGVGGSYAQFQINDNALYKVDKYKLNVYNITDPINTFFDKEIYMNTWFSGEFETLFKQKEYLFIGSTQGMYVVNALDEFNPVYISGFSHATACDPVYVHNNTAYITVRGGNTCGAIEDQINVLDITDISNPTLVSTYLTNQPMGVGYKDNKLYVCSGSNGLKVFDATNNAGLVLQNTFDMNVTDVIPLDSHLILVGPNKVIQMNYAPNYSLTTLSEINF